jgi:hypothetical protein
METLALVADYAATSMVAMVQPTAKIGIGA